MKRWALYDLETGVFTGTVLSVPDESALARNTPEGQAAIALTEKLDHLTQRVDVETGEIIAYTPPRPSRDHVFNPFTGHWQVDPAVEEARNAPLRAKVEIAQQEALSLRAIRELLLDPDNEEARAKLQEVDDKIALAREVLTDNTRLEEVPPN